MSANESPVMAVGEAQRLRELLAKATPGPWVADHDESGDYLRLASINGCGCCGSPNCDPNDAALIVAAVNALPALLDSHAAMAAEVEALRERVKLYGFMQNTGAADELRARAEAAEARCEGLEAALRNARDYVASELDNERSRFKGYERCSEIPSIEADLAQIDSLLTATRTTGGDHG